MTATTHTTEATMPILSHPLSFIGKPNVRSQRRAAAMLKRSAALPARPAALRG